LDSNGIDVTFIARRQHVQLGFEPVNGQYVKWTVSCANDSEQDRCYGVSADHWDGFVYSFFGASGTDRYQLQLANGWSLESTNFHVDRGTATLLNTPAPGATDIRFAVSWSLGGFDTETIYFTGITLVGPLGVPLQ
jgi:outer membrane protein assembly factor BamB